MVVYSINPAVFCEDHVNAVLNFFLLIKKNTNIDVAKKSSTPSPRRGCAHDGFLMLKGEMGIIMKG